MKERKNLTDMQVTDLFTIPDSETDLPKESPSSQIPGGQIVAEVDLNSLNGPEKSFYGEVGYAKELVDCDQVAATTFEITALDEGAAESYAKDLQTRLRDWVRNEDNPDGVLIITVEGRKISVTSLSGDPIVQVSVHAAHIASAVRSTAFKKEAGELGGEMA